MDPRKKTPQPFARSTTIRSLAAETTVRHGSRLPTAAAMQLALVSSVLLTGTMLGACSAVADDGSISADARRRPTSHTVDTSTSPVTPALASANSNANANSNAGVAPTVDPVPHAVKGEMMMVVPTGSATAIVKPPTTAAIVAPTPTLIPRPLAGRMAPVRPIGGGGPMPSLGSVPCDKPIAPETT